MKFSDRPLESFQKDIEMIKKKGFDPIAVAQMMYENYYVFETKHEALKAYSTFEVAKSGEWLGEIVGWWTSKDDFDKSVKIYEEATSSEVLVHWL